MHSDMRNYLHIGGVIVDDISNLRKEYCSILDARAPCIRYLIHELSMAKTNEMDKLKPGHAHLMTQHNFYIIGLI